MKSSPKGTIFVLKIILYAKTHRQRPPERCSERWVPGWVLSVTSRVLRTDATGLLGSDVLGSSALFVEHLVGDVALVVMQVD